MSYGITSLLDIDLYKATMCQLAFHQFPDTEVTYGFKCRTKGIDFGPSLREIKFRINNLANLEFTSEELSYLKSLPFMKDDFVNSLEGFKLDPKSQVKTFIEDGELRIEIAGKWTDTIWYEIPVLAIVNQVYFEYTANYEYADFAGMQNLHEKIQVAKWNPNIKFADFGTRRRFSKTWQETVVKILASHKDIGLIGTSNMLFAMKNDLKPIGTMAHEFLQAAQVLAPSLEETQKFAFDCWREEYGDQLQVALTDIFGIDVFLKDFDKGLAEHYDGVRHDSGSETDFANKMIEFYSANGIDPKTKTIVFSDGLTFGRMDELQKQYGDQINVAFGIGTNLTNDCGYKPLSIVMKMITCNGKPTVKLSDSPGKIMCRDENYIKEVREMIAEKLND